MAGVVDYQNKTAVITGASSGIGAEFARQLSRRGAHVALVARRAERLAQLSREIAAAGGEASVHVCDVANRSAVETACRDVVGRWGGIDLLINNAGSARHTLFQDHEVEDIERLMQTNYFGAVYWIKNVVPLMRARRAGWIVNISSLAGLLPQPDEAAYSATKFALTGLSEALAYELAPLGIHLLVVHPALVRTEMLSAEVLARLPRSAAGSIIEADVFVAATLRALERGQISVIIPRRFGAVCLLRSLAPHFIGRALAMIKLRALPDWTG
jgi:short-subunit dehydrogenase